MAGAMRKMAVYLGLVEDEDGEPYDDYEGYDEGAGPGSAARDAAAPAATGG